MNRICLIFFAVVALAAMPFKAGAYNASFYTEKSLLASGHWVKVQVDTTSIYEISYDDLKSWGFSDPSKVSVYGLGAVGASNHKFDTSYTDDLKPAAYIHTDDGRLLFFGEGDRQSIISRLSSNIYYPTFARNYYDTRSFYFLTDSQPLTKMATSSFSEAGIHSLGVVEWHFSINLDETEAQNPAEGGVFFHGPKRKAGDKVTSNFRIRDFYQGNGTPIGYFRYEAAVKNLIQQKFSTTAKGLNPTSTVDYSASTINSNSNRMFETGTGISRFTATAANPLQDKEVSFTVNIPANFAGSYVAIDRTYLIYPRRNVIRDDHALVMFLYNISSNQIFRLFDATPTSQVWNITNPVSITSLQVHQEDGDDNTALVSLPVGGTSPRLIYFDSAKPQRPVSYAGVVPNNNLHGLSTPDMLIVTTATNAEAARELADIHRQLQGLDVHVAVQDEIFNEFSFGSRHPGAVRRLAKMFYDRNPSKFKYLRLYGRPTWDNRFIQRDSADFLISYQIENLDNAKDPTTNPCADQYFGMLSDSYSHSLIATGERMLVSVGRIPVENPSLARDVNEKIRHYLQNPPTAREYSRSILIGGEGDAQAHLKQANQADSVLTYLNPRMTSVRADVNLYPLENGNGLIHRDIIHRALAAGTGLFNFSGHADHTKIAANTYTINTLGKYNYDKYPLAVLSTCDTWPMDQMSHTLSEEMLFKKDGGMIGIIAACRSVYLDPNRMLNNAILTEYTTAAPGTTIGDLFRLARNRLIVDGGGKMTPSLGNNTLCYNLCGDPAIPIAAPHYSVAIDKVGQTIGQGVVTVQPLAKTEIAARITDSTGKLVSGFNGDAVIDIYQAPVSIKTQNGEKPVLTVNVDDNLLVSIPAKVENGVISLSSVLPVPSSDGKYNRVVITAKDSSSAKLAAGGSVGVKIAYNTDAIADGIDAAAPVIEKFIIGDSDFVSGDAIGTDSEITAVIDPSASGLAFSSKKIGRQTRLVLDGVTNLDYILSSMRLNADGKFEVNGKIKNLPDGHHSLKLQVVNNIGEEAVSTIDFVVISKPFQIKLATDTDKTVRTSIDFDIDADGHELTSTRLVISDHRGNTVLSREVSFPYTWDLCDDSNVKVPDGKYRASVKVASSYAKGSSNTIPFIIIK